MIPKMAEKIAQAEEVFYLANNRYTNNMDDLDISTATRIDKNLFLLGCVEDCTTASITTVRENIVSTYNIGYVVYFDNNAISGYRHRRECQVDTTAPAFLHTFCQETLNTTTNFQDGERTIYYTMQ